jgi:hypothetical protein
LLAWTVIEIGVNLHSGKGDVDNVSQLGLISWGRAVSESEHVVELGKGIDSNRDESSLEIVAVLPRQLLVLMMLQSSREKTDPEEHPSGNTGITKSIPGCISQCTLFYLTLISPELSEPE